MFNSEIRESVVEGSFYPANPDTLKKEITGFLDNTPDMKIKNISGLVCPHAGYIYSGQVAAYSYRQVMGKSYDCVFIIAPSHSEYFDFNSVFAGKAYQTPLGPATIDRQRCLLLAEDTSYSDYIKISDYGHRREHSLEVQIPFLQVSMNNPEIVPIVMGSQKRQNIESLGNAIGNLFRGQNILIIASTDLSHYHPYSTAAELDSRVQKQIKNFNPEEFTDEISSDRLEMCGGGPVASAMIACRLMGADNAEILCYKNSGDVSGDRSAVVGYLSAAFYKI